MRKSLVYFSFCLAVIVIGLLLIGCGQKRSAPRTSAVIVKIPTDADFAKNSEITEAQLKSIRSDRTVEEFSKDLGSIGIQLPGRFKRVFWTTKSAVYLATFKDNKLIRVNIASMPLKAGDSIQHAIQVLGKPDSIEDRSFVIWGGKNQAYYMVEFRDGRAMVIVFLQDKQSFTTQMKSLASSK